MREKLKETLKRFRDLIVEYGVIALIVHYVIFAIVIVSFWAAIRSGWQPTSTAANVGTWTAAYIAAKITQPLRIVATIAVTPFIARVYEKLTGSMRAPGDRAGKTSKALRSDQSETADDV